MFAPGVKADRQPSGLTEASVRRDYRSCTRNNVNRKCMKSSLPAALLQIF